MKYFITSDVHSYYTPFIDALLEVYYDKNNPNHTLIVDGDLFDRGQNALILLAFIKSIPKENRVLIRGNHEYLLKNLLDKEYPDYYDFSNGTVSTCFQLIGSNENNDAYKRLYYEAMFSYYSSSYYSVNTDSLKKTWKTISNKVKKTKIIDWIFNSDEWCDYYELDNYIITHAFIPVHNPTIIHMYNANVNKLEIKKDWRTDSDSYEIEQSTWGCPYKLFNAGLFNEEIKNGKTLICGHWNCSDFNEYYLGKINYDKQRENYNIFYSKHLIAIDAHTAYSGWCNVLVIEDGECYQHNTKLAEKIKLEEMLKKDNSKEPYFI